MNSPYSLPVLTESPMLYPPPDSEGTITSYSAIGQTNESVAPVITSILGPRVTTQPVAISSSTDGTAPPLGINWSASPETDVGAAQDPNVTGLLSTFLNSAQGEEGLNTSLNPNDTNANSGSVAQPLGIQASFADAPTTTTTTSGGGSGVFLLGVVLVAAIAAFYYFRHKHPNLPFHV